ncbi:MAG: GTPase HflX [Chloroflexi bacterium]|nr:GTPase HflX [Chloroflexota bacterium]MQC26729.1 GTPase HflX [Chloroflexota bacterium]
MPKGQLHSTERLAERALLVGVEISGQPGLLPLEDSLEELELLAVTAGLDVVGFVTQQLTQPNSKTFIGSGKVDEVKALADELDARVILFDDELNPRHQRELETLFKDNRRVIDRTALILDIFAQHASTHEGALQVELAQYEYRLPRLTRAWTHLARQAGGGGGRAGGVGGVGLRGPGETQLEVDRREIGRRITHLKKELEKVRAHRSRYRARRKRSRVPVVALVGYTNAGKSTLLNALADSDVYVANKLFATLDPTTRRVELTGGREALFTDTVGFIQKLPTTLVESFQATLEEIKEAELLIHVLDITHPFVDAQAEAVHETLGEIGADHVPTLTVLNKIDRLEDPLAAQTILEDFEDAVAVSALKGTGLEELLAAVSRKLYESLTPIEVHLPFEQGALIALFHEQGQVERIEHTRKGVNISGRIPGRLITRYTPFTAPEVEEPLPDER